MPLSLWHKLPEGDWNGGGFITEVHECFRYKHAVRTEILEDIFRPVKIVPFLRVAASLSGSVNVVESDAKFGIFVVFRECKSSLHAHHIDQPPGPVLPWGHPCYPIAILRLGPYPWFATGKSTERSRNTRGEPVIKAENIGIKTHESGSPRQHQDCTDTGKISEVHFRAA